MQNKRSDKIKRNVILIIAIIIVMTAFVSASTFIDNSSSNFNNGTYNWTFYNSSGFVQLNSSRLNGTFTSQVFNTNSISQWNNISWIQRGYYGQELPSNQQVETGLSGINMSGNVLLMHLNETSGIIYDSSGYGNNGIQSGGIAYSATGKLGSAIRFDGNNDFINISHSTNDNLKYDRIIEINKIDDNNATLKIK